MARGIHVWCFLRWETTVLLLAIKFQYRCISNADFHVPILNDKQELIDLNPRAKGLCQICRYCRQKRWTSWSIFPASPYRSVDGVHSSATLSSAANCKQDLPALYMVHLRGRRQRTYEGASTSINNISRLQSSWSHNCFADWQVQTKFQTSREGLWAFVPLVLWEWGRLSRLWD